MIETWKQYTCDGCGETEFFHTPNATNAEVRKWTRKYGWRNIGLLDYCRVCVKNGTAEKRITDMSQ